MKAGIIGTVALAILTLISVIILTVNGRAVRQAELNTSLTNAIEQSMEVLYLDNSYEIQNAKGLIADFTGSLLQQFNSDSDISLEILNIDFEEGLLDVRATEKYQHFTGSEGVVTCRKTVILEEYTDSCDTYYQVIFQNADGSTFRAYTMYQGTQLTDLTLKPVGFIRWEKINEDGSTDTAWNEKIDEIIVQSNLVFKAVCE